MNAYCDYLMCVREHEDQEFFHDISGINGKEVFQLVHGHVPADLKKQEEEQTRS